MITHSNRGSVSLTTNKRVITFSLLTTVLLSTVLLQGCGKSPAEAKVFADYTAATKQCDALSADSRAVCFATAEVDRDCALAEARHPSRAAQLAMSAGFPAATYGTRASAFPSTSNGTRTAIVASTVIASAN